MPEEHLLNKSFFQVTEESNQKHFNKKLYETLLES